MQGWVPALCRAEGLWQGPAGRLGRGVPTPTCPRAPSSRGLIHAPHLLLEQVPCCGAGGDAGTPVPVCMYPQPAVPDSCCKSSPGSGLLLPSRAASFTFASPGENLPGRKGPGQSTSPLCGAVGPFPSLASLGTPLCRGAGRLWGAVGGGLGGCCRPSWAADVASGIRETSGLIPQGEGVPAQAVGEGRSGVGPGLWSVIKSARPTLVPGCSLRAPGTGPRRDGVTKGDGGWHWVLATPSLPWHQLSAG